MVKFTASVVALAMAAAVTAAPAPSSETTFSFASWVEDIIANPDTALSPEQAVAAANSAALVSSAGGLTKRAECVASYKDAPVRTLDFNPVGLWKPMLTSISLCV